MKLKYKKIILMTTMGAMGIGMLTLSITKDKISFAKKQGKEIEVVSSGSDVDPTEELTKFPTLTPTEKPVETITPTAEPTEEPTKAPLPVYDLERDAYPEINDLFMKYYAARLACDLDMMATLISDPTYLGTAEDIQVKTEYIEDYRNIECYTKKTYEENSYIVYVSCDIKFVNIETLAPGINKYYVKLDQDGKAQIIVGDVDDEFYEYYVERDNDEDVRSLYEAIDQKGEEAKTKDADLMKFWMLVDGMVDTNDEGEADTTAEE